MFPIKETNQNNQELTFAEQVDNVLSGHSSRYNDLKVCDTPKILLDVGCKQLPLFYTQKHLRDALKTRREQGHARHYHDLTVQQIKKFPELISNPVLIYDSLSRNDSLVIVTSEVNKENNPIVAAIRPNGTANYEMEIVDSNFVLSIYGKNNFENQILKALGQNKILYYNKQKSQDLFSVLGLQSPQGFNNLDSDIIIHQSKNIINSNLQKNSVLSKNKGADYMKVQDTQQLTPQAEQKSDILTQRQVNFATEPTVTIIWSEHDYFKDGDTMSLSEADTLMQRLNEEVMAVKTDDGPAYYKTKFQINCVMNGQPEDYTGRYDLGDDGGTLIEHIEKYHSYYHNNEEWDKNVLKFSSPEKLKTEKEMHERSLKEFVPYLKLHTTLSEMERNSKKALQETNYDTAIQKYVANCRSMLNQGNYDLPPVPQHITIAEDPVRVKAVEQYRDSIDNIIQYYALQDKGWQLTHEFAAECIYSHNTDALLAILYKNSQLQPDTLQDEFLNLCNNLEKAIKELDSTEYSPKNAEAIAAITSEEHSVSITDVSMQETLIIDVNTDTASYDMAYLPITFVPDTELKQEIKNALEELVTENMNQQHQEVDAPKTEKAPEAPTEKQINFANRIAETLDIELQAQTKTEYQQFIKENMDAYRNAQQHQEVDAPKTEKAPETPTEKQINFANRIAETLDIELQAQTKTEYQQFIKENMDAYRNAQQHQEVDASETDKAPEAPTEKQINFANRIAETLDIELQAQTKADYQQFIKENIDAYQDAQQHQEENAPETNKPSEAPTERQISFANKIVATLGVELTAQTRADYQQFIDANKEIYRNFEKMPSQKRPYTKSLNECLTGWKWEHQADGSGRLIMPDGQEYGKYDLNSQEYTVTHEQQEQEWTKASSPIKKLELSAIRLQLNINTIDSQDISTLQCIDEVAGSLEASDVSDMSLDEGTPDLDGGGFAGFGLA